MDVGVFVRACVRARACVCVCVCDGSILRSVLAHVSINRAAAQKKARQLTVTEIGRECVLVGHGPEE